MKKLAITTVVASVVFAAVVILANSFRLALDEPYQVRTVLPTPGVPRTIPACNLTTPGSAWTKHQIHNGLLGSDGVKIADFDGDGDMDVVSPWEQGGATTLSLNPGPSAVRSASDWSTAQVSPLASNEGACVGDIDLDGRLDILSTSSPTGVLSVKFGPALNSDLLDPADWTTMALTAFNGSGRGYMTCAITDLTGDAIPDLVIGAETGGSTGEIFYITGPAVGPRVAANWGLFTARTTIETSGRIMSIWNLDLDGDTDMDLIYSTRALPNTGIHKALNNGSGTMTPSLLTVLRAWACNTHVYMQFVLYDMDTDGDLDMCSTTESTCGRCLYNMGGTFTKWVDQSFPQPANFGNFTSSAAGDFNLDGYPDLVVASFDAAAGSQSGLVWLKGPYWTRGEIEGTAHTVISKWDELVVLDLDDDGDEDVIAGNQGDEDGVIESDEGLYWFENPCRN